MGRYDGHEFIWERVPQTTSFKFDRSVSQGTVCLFKMTVHALERVLYIYGAYNSEKIITENGWKFILMINTVMNKFQNLISMKFRKSESIKICIKFDNGSIASCLSLIHI